MKKLLVVCLLLAGCASFAPAAGPFSSLEEFAANALGASAGLCGENTISVAGAKIDSREYTIWASETRFVLGLFNGDNLLTLWFGVIDPGGKFSSVREEQYDPDIHKTPCQFLFPAQASAGYRGFSFRPPVVQLGS